MDHRAFCSTERFSLFFNMCVKISLVQIFVLNSVITTHCSLKRYRFNNDIFDPVNWVNGKPQEECGGLIFPVVIDRTYLIKNLAVSSLILPENGIIELTEGAMIELNATSKMNCVELKSSHYHSWEDPSSWITVGKEENYAIPDSERVPCEYDDVDFPHGELSGSIMIDAFEKIKIKSFKFDNETWSNEDLELYSKSLMRNFLTFESNMRDVLYITNEGCKDESGCLCGNDKAYIMNCRTFTFDEEMPPIKCDNPITPIGFCDSICGASILIEPSKNLKLTEMEEILEEYESQTYVSKVKNYSGHEFVQIIFTEKKFIGYSLDDARHFYKRIKQDFQPGSVTLYSSGDYNNIDGEFKNNAASLVFGTLCSVLLVFLILFLVYSPNGTAIMLRNRLNLGTNHLTGFRTTYFTRHSSIAEDAGLIFEGPSMAGSLLSLNKSFDNPMYGKDERSTASTLYPSNDASNQDVGEVSNFNSSKSVVEIGKSMADVADKDFGTTSEGELVDLSDM